ncbi:cadherin-like domain-containing protein [Vibrio lentus]|uniref:cadherin-like domain-containing protein n=1 Tax=Vibrio lentus TaxID=136468 RepID=UPI001D04AD0D|nr:cadherin-like domain-containing protein [Vibrio lentus]
MTVTPVNDAPELTGDLSAEVDEAGSYTITAADLGYTDVDDTDTGVTFTVSNASNGTILVNGVASSSFTVAQLAAGEVTFKHDGSETTSASFDVNVEDGNEDGSTPVDSTFNLTVTPVNDAPELTGDLSAEVDEAGSYTITAADLGYTDVDDTDTGVTFTVSNASNGTILVNGVASSSFTVAQLAAGEVTFKHDGSETTSASFDVNVEDGNEDGSTPVDSTFNLTVTPVNDAPELTGDLSAEVDEAGSYTITAADLGYTDVDDTDTGVTFTVSNASNGTILVNGVASSSFTVAQLAAGEVTFKHDGSETTSASFDVNVEDGNEDGSTPVDSTFNLTVTPVNDAPELTGDLSAEVDEAGSYTITAADLGYTDVDDTDTGVTFTVSNASNGTILVNGVASSSFTVAQLAAGEVTFKHDGSETTSASFDVNVEDGNEDGSTPVDSTFNLTVTPVNDAPELTGDLSAEVDEAGSYTITAADLGYTDVDDTDTGVTFTVSNASNGTILVNGVASSSFTVAQLAAGEVTFKHDGSETTSASFDVNVEDGNEDGSTPVDSTFNLTVTPVNDAPELTGDLSAEVDEAGSYTITAADLGYTDVDDTDTGVTFTVSNASNGTILVNGVASSSFTVAQLAAGEVTFKHDGSETTSASFDVNVEDGNEDGSTPVDSTFNLTVTPVNDAPELTGDLSAEVDEAGSYTITAADLGYTDVDDTDTGVTFTVSNASNGTILVNGVASSSFTVAQLAAGEVTFKHDGSETTSASFDVNVEDGNEDGSTPVDSTFNLTVTPVNDAPELTGDLSAEVMRQAATPSRRRTWATRTLTIQTQA